MKTLLLKAVTVLLVAILSSCSTEALDTGSIPQAKNSVGMESELLDLINAHRTEMGYPTLTFSEVAYDYANRHTDYMIAMGTINHDNFSARASGISSEAHATQVAENVANKYATAQRAFDEWLASDGHRKNMEGDFTHTAVSVKSDSSGTFYYTQLFYKR
ncbi:MAG: CAP domain-containing protein [Sediminicola sp.]|tara:strand:- start:812 stop:1291 length:480 start_codon:yes stop_codon:yes gene_type:complete